MQATLLNAGDQHLKAGRFVEALSAYYTVMKADPKSSVAWHRAGLAAHQAGRLTDSIFLLEKALELSRNSGELWSDSAMVLNSLGQFEEALHASRRAVTLDKTRADSYLHKGVAESRLGLHWTAMASYSQALTFNPRHSVAFSALEQEWQATPRFPHPCVESRNAETRYRIPSGRRPTHFVSLTRGTKEQTDIYQSFQNLGIESFDIVEHNTRGIPDCYNEFLDHFACQDMLLVFVHDDVRLTDTFVREKLTEASGWFNIIGVAGSSQFNDVGQQRLSWRFATEEQFLSGSVHHEPEGWSGFWATYGLAPKECVTLDGLFLAIDMLRIPDLRFDPRYRFHFYDLDFCVAAATLGYIAGTADITLSHRSLGDITTDSYREATRTFREKWQDPVTMSLGSAKV